MKKEQFKEAKSLIETIEAIEKINSRRDNGWTSDKTEWDYSQSEGYGARFFYLKNMPITKSTEGGRSNLERVFVTENSDGSGASIMLTKAETFALQEFIKDLLDSRKSMLEARLELI